MIQRLQLHNWRAYDRLDLELGPGATFVVASNGIGKTSLIMAAAWGIFGDVAGVKGAEEIRGDAENATVTVELRLPSSGAMAITRTIDQRGKTAVVAKLGERTLHSQVEVEQVLAAEFGADARVLAQLTFMIHGGLHETQGEFKLQDHLAGLFGVRPMFEAAARAEASASEAASTLRKTKVVERKDQRQAEELLESLEAAAQEVERLGSEREAAVGALNEAAEGLRRASEWANYQAALVQRSAKLQAYAELAGSMLGRPLAPDEVLDALAAWEMDVEQAVSEAEAEAAAAQGKTDFIRDSITHLESSDAACPMCLRPFSEHDAERAVQEQAAHLASLEATITQARGRAQQKRAVLVTLRKVVADVRSVPVPVEPSAGDPGDSLEEVRLAHDAAREAVQRLDQETAMRSASLASIRDALAAIEQDRERESLQEALFRREGLATAAAQVLRETAERIVTTQIEPLVGEVARRWKQTFGRGGLQLSADGRITRRMGSRTLSFGALSGGERVWALLVTRLLVAGASTRAPFVWLDEPLEHLDPRLRRIVAGTLAMAASRSGLRQVVVTTYEAPIAEQLMEDVPSASLVYVTSSQ